MNKIKKLFICVLTMSLLGLVSQVMARDVAPVELKSFPKTYQFDARIEAVNEATVSSHISAQVVEINYDVDDKVPEGAVLLRFSDTEFKARLSQAKSALSAAEASYQEALARQAETKAEAKRVTELFARKQVTRSALDKAQADETAAVARLASVKAQTRAAQAQVEEAEQILSYTVVKAPYAGTVTHRHIEVGEMATPGQLLMSGLSETAMRAIVKVPQRLITPVSASTDIQILADGQWYQTGALTVLPEADELSHSFTVRVAIERKLNFYQGSMTKIQFINGTEKVLVVPQQAILQRSEVSGIYVQTPHGIVFRQLRLGRALGDWVEVLAGLDAGELVLNDPKQYLHLRAN